MKLDIAQRVKGLLRHALVQNALSLYGVQVSSYVVPLVTIPYLARVLGATGWGLVAFAQAFGAYTALIGEYGFALSATREIARNRDKPEELSEIVAGVMGAKTLLAVGTVALAFLVHWWIPIFQEHPLLFWAAMFWAVGQAFNMMWYFQGVERMRLPAALDISAKTLATTGIFLFVHRPGDEWRVLLIQGLGYFLSFTVCVLLMYRETAFRLPSWRPTFDALRMGWSMFLFKSSVSLYTAGNAFILGLFVSPELVGFYAGAEKITRAFLGLLSPINQTLFPRMNHLMQTARERAVRLMRISVGIMGAIGVLLGVTLFVLAPLLVHFILGSSFTPAVPLLRILALLPPLIALSNVFGIQWMLSLGLDRPFNIIILLAGLTNVGLATLLAPRYGATGMALAVVCAETFVTAGIYLVLRLRRMDPGSYSARMKEDAAHAL